MSSRYDSLPDDADLAAFLRTTNLYDGTQELDLEGALDAAISEFERRTRHQPFLASGSTAGAPTTHYFDAPGPRQSGAGFPFAGVRGGGRKLQLDCGLARFDPEQGDALTIAGSSYTLGVQFWLLPRNAPLKHEPYTTIQFVAPVFCNPQEIAITGLWGYAQALPADAWKAILARAAYECFPELSLGISEGMVTQKVDDGQEQYLNGQSQSPLTLAATQWLKNFEGAVKRYRL